MHILTRLEPIKAEKATHRPIVATTLICSLAMLMIHSAAPTGSRVPLVAEASPTQALSSGAGPAPSGGGGGGGIAGGGGAIMGVAAQESKGVFKRSFAGLGCLGVYDKAKFARLDRVCEECYTLYREPDIHSACRQDCFRNSVFTRCVDALLLSHEAKKFDEMVEELYGK